MIEKAVEFIKKPWKKIAIIFGHDCDSIASAVIVYKLLKKLKKKPALIVSKHNYSVGENELNKVKKRKAESVIVLDIGNIDSIFVKKLKNKLMIIDHHMPKRYGIKYYVNPRLKNREAYIPVAYVVWKIYSKFFDEKEVDWIAGIGVLGDHGVEETRDLFLEIKRNKKELVRGKLTSEALFKNSLLGKLVSLINAANVVAGIRGVKYATRVLIKAKDYKDVLSDKTLGKWEKELKKELERIEQSFKKNKIVFGKFLLFVFDSSFKIKSTFAGMLSERFYNKIIMVGQRSKNLIEFSVRRGKRVHADLNELVKKLSESIESLEGGGHPAAAGFRIKSKDLDRLLEKLKRREKSSLG